MRFAAQQRRIHLRHPEDGLRIERPRSLRPGTFPAGSVVALVCVQLLALFYWINFSIGLPAEVPSSWTWDGEAHLELASHWVKLNLLVVIWLALHVWLRRRSLARRRWMPPTGNDRLHATTCLMAAAGLSLVSFVVWLSFDLGARHDTRPVAVLQRTTPWFDVQFLEPLEHRAVEDFRCAIDRTQMPLQWSEGLSSCREAGDWLDVVESR